MQSFVVLISIEVEVVQRISISRIAITQSEINSDGQVHVATTEYVL